MDDKKYLLFSAVGFNDPVGSILNSNSAAVDRIVDKIDGYYKENKITSEKKDELLNYFNKKIVYSEGSILSIVRKYKPEGVMLFFTKDMSIRKDNNGTSIIDILKNEIVNRSKKCSYDNIFIKESNIIANSFDNDLVGIDNKNFTEMIEELKSNYEHPEEYEILVNITSGTNQIKTKLALECIYSKENNIKAVYLSPPIIRESIRNEEKYEEDDGDYSYTEDIDNNYENIIRKEEDKINYVKDLYEEYEQLESDFNDEKYLFPDFKVFISLKIKNQISALLEKSYEYSACYDLFKNDSFINNNCEDVLTLLKYADLRSNLKYTDDDLNINNISTNPICRCLQEFYNKLNLFNDKEKILVEYFYIMKLKQQKGDLSDFILRLEPFLDYVNDKKNNFNIGHSNIKTINSELINIKNKLRHTVAHQMVNVSEGDIKKETNGKTSKYIIYKCSELLELIFVKKFDKEYFIYDEINKKILERF